MALDGPKESCVRWGSRCPMRGKERPFVKNMEAVPWAVQKWLNRLRFHLGYGLGLAQETMYWRRPDPPCEEVIIRGKDMTGLAWSHSAVSCAKMAEPVDLVFVLWTLVGMQEAKLSYSLWIRFYRPFVAVMRPYHPPYVILLWPLVDFYCSEHSQIYREESDIDFVFVGLIKLCWNIKIVVSM